MSQVQVHPDERGDTGAQFLSDAITLRGAGRDR
jgi:hypothetical protein